MTDITASSPTKLARYRSLRKSPGEAHDSFLTEQEAPSQEDSAMNDQLTTMLPRYYSQTGDSPFELPPNHDHSV